MSRTVFIALLIAAASPAWGAWAGPRNEDRYGPTQPATPVQGQPLILLTWPGKAAAATPSPRAPTPPAPAAFATPARAPLPASLYAPTPPPAPAPAPRRYSAARDIGPDAAPLPPQFFADAATDLAEPPAPPPVTAPAGQSAAAIAARNRAADASSQVN